MVWLNYEFAWGGTYQSYYKEQSLNNIPIDKDHLQPIKFQGQYYDPETSLHYNRFRYYDSDVGMFIQRDQIGLLGGLNTFQYAPNPIEWVDPWGLSGWKKGTPKPANWRLPKKGTWSGEVGHSTFTPTNPEKYGLKAGDFIQYKGGRPDFSPWANNGKSKGYRVTGMNGDPKHDRGLMLKAFAEKMNWTQTEASNYLKVNNLDLHHHSTNVAQIVPRDLHNGLRHTGPASKMRNQCTK
ncbi:hypothetical protein HO539_07525 [Streptococcus suis]|nr:hypothetical protein [Streptococcus suis]NQJ73138.1 hypothetical protein [Streptococcus suis]NQJ77710.1 hypothetical protein [Streptococcus suis]NRG69783.1 hypothetical protein [Streptococcus suis]